MRNLIWGFILVAIGLLLLLDNLGVADFGEVLHDYWPLLLVLWGIGILMKNKSDNRSGPAVVPSQPGSAAPPESVPSPPPSVSGPPPQTAPSTGNTAAVADLIHDSNVFGDLHVLVHSQSFKGGSVSTVFGNCIIDLSAASVATGDHELRIHAVFGNITVVLGNAIAVSVSANTFLGDIVSLGQSKSGISPDILNETASYGAATSRLKIISNTVFGNIRVS